jgi:hypothetical protein
MQHGSNRALGEVFFALCKSFDTPRSLALWLMFKHGEHKQLAEMTINPGQYSSAETLKVDYFATSFLSKYKGLETGIDLRETAIQQFISAEEKCMSTNLSLREASVNGFKNPFTGAVVHTATRKIAALLGKIPDDMCFGSAGWGPGATFDIPRRRAYADLKMTELPISVTQRCLPYGQAAMKADLHWSAAVLNISPHDICGDFSFTREVFAIVDGAKFETVPKNAKTDRSILVEPRLNAFLQKGVGAKIRRDLRKVGVDLNDQSINQRLAGLAHQDSLSTIDLKAASDSVSRELVFMLLPLDWACYLDRLRSWCYVDQGIPTKLHKFSSMGNGFTFELESLIFWSITSSVTDLLDPGRPLAIYGDDIICSRSVASNLVDVLSDLGFTTNKEKSFIDGRFFESCGRHYFDGKEVTPVYQKEDISDVQEHLRLSNRLLRAAVRLSVSDGTLWGPVENGWRTAFRGRDLHSDNTFLPLGAEGDDGWLATHDMIDFARDVDINHGFNCHVWREHLKSFPGHEPALLALALRSSNERTSSFLGVLSAKPSYGDVASKKPTFSKGWRRVLPDGSFGMNWT